MNEVEWLAGIDPAAMLTYLEGKVSDRKLRLFACACVRRYWNRLRWPAPREAVATAERYAEGQASDAELEERRQQAEMSAMPGFAPEYEQPLYQAAWATTLESAIEAAQQTREFIRLQAVREAAYEAAPWENEARRNAEASAAECRLQCELIREIFGNPFRPVTVDPSWLSISAGAGAVILQAVDQEQRFEELPYLGDALLDAGCSNEALLSHLRSPRGHVRGCWAVDLLMGRG
jgi:hypothetical protein